MTEYAKLVLAVDSSQAASASGDLKGLEAQGGKTESALLGMSKGAAIAAAAIAAAAAATVAMVAASVQAADAAGEAAQAAGITTAEFTRLQYAMQFDGAPESLGASMKFLNKAVADAAVGAGNNAEMFAAMGVSIKNQDGTLRSSHDVLLQVSDRFAGMQDGAQKAALATEIFGKAGADMIPFLNNGAAGIAALEAEADQLGITISDETAAAAGHLSDTFGRMSAANTGFANTVTSETIPAITSVAEGLLSTATNSGIMEVAATALSVAIKVVAVAGEAVVIVLKTIMTAGIGVAAILETVGQTIGAVAAAAVAVAGGDFKGAAEIMKSSYGDAVGVMSSAMQRADAMWSNSAGAVEAAEQRKRDAMGDTAAAALAAKDGGDAKAAEKAAKDLAAEEAAAQRAADAAAKRAAIQEAAEQKAAAAKAARDTAAWDKQVADDQAQYERLNLRFASEAELEALAYEKKIADYRWYAEQKGIAESETNATLQTMAQEHAAKMNEIETMSAQAKMSTAIGAIGDIAGAFASHSKSMFRVQKVAAIAQGMLSIQTGIANAMSLPFPANLVAAAKVAATGAGIMSNIKSLSDSGGGAGIKAPTAGGVSLGGATGGGASVAPAAAPARQPTTTDIRLVGIRPDDMISGSYLQKIIAGIGETLADNGGRMGKVELVMSA